MRRPADRTARFRERAQPPRLCDATGVDAELLAAAAACPRLESLDIGNTSVGDVELQSLAPATNLKRLHLVGTEVTDACGATLSVLTNLEDLNVGDTAVTDAVLTSISDLPNLKSLHIGATQISEAGLDVVAAGFPSLSVLRTLGLDLSDGALAKFNETRPGVSVE